MVGKYKGSARERSYEAYYLRNRDKILAKDKKWRAENPEQRMLMQSKARAKENNLEFNLDIEDIVIPDVCPVLGTPMDRLAARAKSSPSLDRIDNTKGYVKGNVLVISHRANTWKSDMSIDDVQKLLIFMEKYFE